MSYMTACKLLLVTLLCYLSQHSCAARTWGKQSAHSRSLQGTTEIGAAAQCGGKKGNGCGASTKACDDAAYTGYRCPSGYYCSRQDANYWQCQQQSTLEPLEQCGGLSGGPKSGKCNNGNSGNNGKVCADAPYTGCLCPSSYSCLRSSSLYWQCIKDSNSTASSSTSQPPTQSPSSGTGSVIQLVNQYQCGGAGLSCNSTAGSTRPCTDAAWVHNTCANGYNCSRVNAAVWWCTPTTNTTVSTNRTNATPGGNTNNTVVIINITDPTTNAGNTILSSSPTAPGDCLPIAGLSTSAGSTNWWPYTLKQLFQNSAQAAMPLTSPLYQTTGSFGASITVNNASSKAWHVQLSSTPAWLEAGKYYTLKFAATSSAPTYLQVALVQDASFQLVHLTQPKVTHGLGLYTIFDLAPLAAANYLINFDLGLAQSGTNFLFDDIMVCEQTQGMLPMADLPGSQLVTAASSDFETPTSYKVQVVAPAAATYSMHSTDAALNGTYGAAVTVTQPGSQTWDIQLAGPGVPLNATKSYTVQLAMKQSGGGSAAASNWVKVTWIDYVTFIAASVNTIVPGAGYMTYTLPPMSPPKGGQYYLTIDFGTAAAGTTIFVDTIKVFEV